MPRRPVTVSFGLALLVSCASPTQPTRGTTPESNGTGVTIGPESAPTDLLRELALRHGVGQTGVEVARIASGERTKFIAYVVRRGSEVERLCESWIREGGVWQLRTQTGELWRNLPAAGSNQARLVTLKGESQRALCGYVDPMLSRIDSLDPGSAVSSSDVPVSGASILPIPEYGQIRAYRNGVLAFAQPIRLTMPAYDGLPTLDDKARNVADDFIQLILAGDADAASALVTGDLEAEPFTRQLLEVLEGDATELSAAETGLGYRYHLRSSVGPRVLTLSMNSEDGEWRVWNYIYAIPASEGEN